MATKTAQELGQLHSRKPEFEAPAMLNHLLDTVEQMRFTSYGETQIATGVPANFQKDVWEYIFRNVVQPMQEDFLMPDITVLLLNQRTKRPGWFKKFRSNPEDLARAETYWQMEVGKVFGDKRLRTPAMREQMQAQLSKVL